MEFLPARVFRFCTLRTQLFGVLLKKYSNFIRKTPPYLQGSSDARHFTKVGCAGVEFGPIGGGIGTDKEWIDIPSLEKYYKILREFLLHLNNE